MRAKFIQFYFLLLKLGEKYFFHFTQINIKCSVFSNNNA